MQTIRSIIISKEDRERLEKLFRSDVADSNEAANLRALRGELDRATVVDPEDVPPDVITLDSTVLLCDSRSSYEISYTLVTPKDAATNDSELSVLTPVGTAILGCRAGDKIRWPVPGGPARFHIKEIMFQPERDGLVL